MEKFDFDEIKWWFADNWQKLVGIILVALFIILGSIVIEKERTKGEILPTDVTEQLAYLEESSEELQKTFSLLDSRDLFGRKKGAFNREYNLFLKEPFIKKSDLERKLKLFVDTVKVKEGVEGLKVRALKFNIYDRHICYEKGYPPVGKYVYTYSFSKLPDKIKNDVDGRYSGVTPTEMAVEYAINDLKKVYYDEFELDGNFRQLHLAPGVEPLSDQEYDWFVKLDQYRTLGGNKLYLAWELGVTSSFEGSSFISNEFDAFLERLHAMGDNTTNFPTSDRYAVSRLKEELVIVNPSLLLYALDGIIDENEITARRKIVENHPGDYDKVIQSWIDKKAADALKLQKEKHKDLPKETPLNDDSATQPTENEIENTVNKETGHTAENSEDTQPEENEDTQPEENEDTQPEENEDTQPEVSEESGQE